MFVSDVMTLAPKSIDCGASLRQARELFALHGIRHLPVTDERDRLVGMLTLADLLESAVMAAGARGPATFLQQMARTPVSEHMSHPPISIEPEQTIERAAAVLREHRVGALPVLDHAGRLVGILTETDVFDVLIDAFGLKEGGARLVYDAPDSQRNGMLQRVLERLGTKGLQVRSVAYFRPRRVPGTARLVVRAVGAEVAVCSGPADSA